jgi:hypothetical protein
MRSLFFLYLFLFSLVGFSQRGPLSKGNAVSANYYTQIDYNWIKGKIIIPVAIEGKTYQFLFDTGAPNLISSELLKHLQTKTVDSIFVTDANSKRKKMEIVSIPKLTIGAVEFQNVSTLVYQYEQNIIFDCFKIDGIIGSNMLRESIVQIIPKEKKLKITNDKKKLALNKKNAIKLSLVGDQRSPYIWIKLHGNKNGKAQVLVDTGMDGFYDLALKHHDIFKNARIYSTISNGIGSKSISLFGNAEKEKQFRVLIPRLQISNAIFNDVLIETTSDNNSRIGSDIFNYGNVTFDFKNKKFYFDSYLNTNDLSEKTFGFSPTIVEKKLVVGIIWDEDLKNKIQLGDEILRINTTDFSTMETCDWVVDESLFEKEENLTIVFKDSIGNTKTYDFIKEFPKKVMEK